MGSHNLPLPQAEDSNTKKASSKAIKSPSHRASKRANTASVTRYHGIVTAAAGVDGRRKRVGKACERCRMRKTKCDGEVPCKRCKNDGLVCTASIRKRWKYKQLPRGYAEVLENTQLTLTATIHKLYSMVRSSQPWELGEPDLNDRGQPVVHSIAQKLFCIQPNCDIDVPVHSVFPGDEHSMVELAHQLEKQQPHDHDAPVANSATAAIRDDESSAYNCAERASSSDPEHFNVGQDYRKMAFGGQNAVSFSPQSFASGSDFEFSTTVIDLAASATSPTHFSAMPGCPSSWAAVFKAPQVQPQQQETPIAMSTSLMQHPSSLQSMIMMDQDTPEVNLGTAKSDILSCANSHVMMGMVDPMIYAGFENDNMRLE